jgi:hypothetical protein
VKINLILRLGVLAFLAWRLWAQFSKSKNTPKKFYHTWLTFKSSEPLDCPSELNICDFDAVKKYYRNNLKTETKFEENTYFQWLTMLFVLEKAIKKGGFGYFLWHKNEWILFFYETLLKINSSDAAKQFEQILIYINRDRFEDFLTKPTEILYAEFSLSGEFDKPFLDNFVLKFNFDEYLRLSLDLIFKI